MTHDPAWAAILTRQCRFDEAAPVAGVYMHAEQARKLQRLKAMKSARAVVRSSGSGIDCVVRSPSPSGARLTFADPVDLPAQFELYLLTENVRVGVSLA